jgi:hypothetical protein
MAAMPLNERRNGTWTDSLKDMDILAVVLEAGAVGEIVAAKCTLEADQKQERGK